MPATMIKIKMEPSAILNAERDFTELAQSAGKNVQMVTEMMELTVRNLALNTVVVLDIPYHSRVNVSEKIPRDAIRVASFIIHTANQDLSLSDAAYAHLHAHQE